MTMQQDTGNVPMLEMRELVAGYGNSVILKGLSMSVMNGEIVALVGANGAGKTTTLRTILGFTTRKGGSVRFKGQDITGLRAYQIVRGGLAYVPQDDKIFPSLTVRENLEMGGYIMSVADLKTNMEHVLNLFPILEGRFTQKAGTLSGGERQMLAIGRGLMASPDIVLLDEPSLGLAPLIVSAVFEHVQAIHEAGVTVLIAEQNARAVLGIADRGYILEFGEIRGEGSARHLLANEEVQKAYLGVE
jgi:branched-chain amino acid transport system ATP-binding protein